MQNINILDPNLGATHPTLVPWVNGMRQAGYTNDQIQMYFRQQMQQQMAGQQAQAQQQQQMHSQQQQQQQQQIQHHPNQQVTPQQQVQQPPQNQSHHQQMQQQNVPPNQQFSTQNDAAQQQRKLQFARNIVQAYTGRVTLEQVLAMPFDRVQNLHNEIVQRLNQSGQHQQTPQQPHHQQVQPQQPQQPQRDTQHHDTQPQYNANNNTYQQQYANYQNQQPQHQNAPNAQPQITIQPPNQNGTNTTTTGPNDANIMFDNENPIDIVLVLLHQYPQIETWLQSMEYHNTVTTSRTHAVQFLTSLMDSQPQFTQLIKLIQQQLKQRRQVGGTMDTNNLPQTLQQLNPLNNTNVTDKINIQTANNNIIMNNTMDDDRMSDTKTKKKSKRSKKKSKKSSKKSSKKAGKKSSKKSKKKRKKKRKHTSEDEDYDIHGSTNTNMIEYASNNESGSDYQAPNSNSNSNRGRKTRKKKSKKKRKKKVRREVDSEPEFTGAETEEEEEWRSGENDDYNPTINFSNIGTRKSVRKPSKKRTLNEMSNGSHTTSRNKKRKLSKRNTNLSNYVSPAPVHWQVQGVFDAGEGEMDEKNKGKFRIRIKVVKHPIKEALKKIGMRTFTMDEMLEELGNIEGDYDIKKTKPARKRLKEELLLMRGCYCVSTATGRRRDDDEYNGDGDSGVVDEFNATDFLKWLKSISKDDVSDDVCYSCGKCGELVCCDGCPHAFHLLCVGLQSVPESKWFCSECVPVSGGDRENNIMNREDVEMGNNGAGNSNNGNDMVGDGGNVGSGVKSGGLFAAVFMAAKDNTRISDLSAVNKVLQKQNEDEIEEEVPEPNIDVNVDGMDVDNSNRIDAMPSPDASDSGGEEQPQVVVEQVEQQLVEEHVQVDDNNNVNIEFQPQPLQEEPHCVEEQQIQVDDNSNVNIEQVEEQFEEQVEPAVEAVAEPVPVLEEPLQEMLQEEKDESIIPQINEQINEQMNVDENEQIQIENVQNNNELEPPQMDIPNNNEMEVQPQVQEEQKQPEQEHQPELPLQTEEENENEISNGNCADINENKENEDINNVIMNDSNNDSNENDTENTDNVIEEDKKQIINEQPQQIDESEVVESKPLHEEIECNDKIEEGIEGTKDKEEELDIGDPCDMVLTGSQEF